MKTPCLSPTELMLRALGEPPTPGHLIGVCGFCGAYTKHGNPLTVGTNFTNQTQMALRAGACACEWCTTYFHAPSKYITSAAIKGTYSTKGFVPFDKSLMLVSLYRLAMHPPEVPFLVLYVGAHQKHLAWFSKITYDPKVIAVNRIVFGKPSIDYIRPSIIKSLVAGKDETSATRMEIDLATAGKKILKQEKTI